MLMINRAERHSGKNEQRPSRGAFSQFKSRRRLIIAGAVVVITAAIGTGVIYQTGRRINQLPETIANQVTFPLYYPAKMPPGFQLDKDSFSATSQVVTYSVTYGDSRNLVVSQQPTPKDFDFEKFYLNSLFGAKEVITPLGKAVIGQIDEAAFASIVTDRTWIIVNAKSGLTAIEMERFIAGFVPATTN
jgi:hypothetical protein